MWQFLRSKLVETVTAAVLTKAFESSKKYLIASINCNSIRWKLYKKVKGSAKMTLIKKLLLITGIVLMPSLGLSGAATDRLSVCLDQNTTYIDRLNLVRWIIKAYASHPAVQDLAAVPQNRKVEIDQIMAGIVQRLVSEDCLDEAKTAIVVDGDVALEAAFEVLGRSAGQSLLTDADVNNEIMGFIDFVDLEKIEALNN